MDSPTFACVTIRISGISDYDAAKVFALVKGKFQLVFEGHTSEFLHLNNDGYPEIFESMWPDGDGYPERTTVHVWNGTAYRPLIKTAFKHRFGVAVQRAIERAARRRDTAAKLR